MPPQEKEGLGGWLWRYEDLVMRGNKQKISPVNSLYADGTLLCSETQNTPDLWKLYRPGSIITGLALWYLRISKNLHHLGSVVYKFCTQFVYCFQTNSSKLQITNKRQRMSQILLPANVTCMLHKILHSWNSWQCMKQICDTKNNLQNWMHQLTF